MPPEAALDLTSDLRELAELAASRDDLDALLRRGLEWVDKLAPYDLATIFELRGERLVVRAARGKLADERVRGHALSLADYPTIREAIQSRRARAYTEDDHAHGDGDPFDGVLDLPHGHSCMVVPLVSGDHPFGLMSLDRSTCGPYPPGVVDLVEVFGHLLALAVRAREQRSALLRTSEVDRQRVRLLERELRGGGAGMLEQSRSPAMRALIHRAKQVAATETPVLLLGETGTGKERLARAVHEWSARAGGPFLTLNCAALAADSFESELFGDERRSGRLQLANGGTLLLEEVAELPLEQQAKLLRFLQHGYFEPAGGGPCLRVDVRILAACRVDPRAAVADGRLREDLYYRLNVLPLELPPLRARSEDLGMICDSMLDELAARTGRRATLTPDALSHLSQHHWSGNLRELANMLERATILHAGRVLTPELLPLPDSDDDETEQPAAVRLRSLDDVQRDHITSVLRHTAGRIYGAGGAAEVLGMKPSTLQSRMRKLGIERRVAVNSARPSS